MARAHITEGTFLQKPRSWSIENRAEYAIVARQNALRTFP